MDTAPRVDRRIVVPDSLVVRVRPIVLVGAGVLVPIWLVASSCGDDGPGDTARFCDEVAANSAELTSRPATLDDVAGFVALYRRIGDVAPLAIEAHWDVLTRNYETASTVEPGNPESTQQALALAYASEESAVAVHDFLVARCGVDLGPVATIVPHQPSQPTGTAVATTAPG
jgi:hypothetical protein